ncbi:unnamed protein product [Coregonus sp. 'balchen']|nr:unnamed protein product [Coregonus sp. 'balchen']
MCSPSQTKYNLPSWCDRVLWKSYPLVHVFCQSYGCTNDIMTSDHSPVFSTFEVGVASQFVSKHEFVKSSEGENQDHSDGSIKVRFGNQVELVPIISDPEYLLDQHILLCVKSTDCDESYEFHVTLTHHGERTGTLTGGVQLRTSAGKQTEKLYDFIKVERDDSGASKGKGLDHINKLALPADITNPSYMGVGYKSGGVADRGWSYSMPPRSGSGGGGGVVGFGGRDQTHGNISPKKTVYDHSAVRSPTGKAIDNVGEDGKPAEMFDNPLYGSMGKGGARSRGSKDQPVPQCSKDHLIPPDPIFSFTKPSDQDPDRAPVPTPRNRSYTCSETKPPCSAPTASALAAFPSQTYTKNPVKPSRSEGGMVLMTNRPPLPMKSRPGQADATPTKPRDYRDSSELPSKLRPPARPIQPLPKDALHETTQPPKMGRSVEVGCNTQDSQLSSSHEEYSDDEISTKKAMHWRLGPEDHDDTMLCDFEMACDYIQEEMLVAVGCITHDSLLRLISHEEYADDEISTKKEMHWRLGPEDHNDTIPYTGDLNHNAAIPYTGDLNHNAAIPYDFNNTLLNDFDMDSEDTQEEMTSAEDGDSSASAGDGSEFHRSHTGMASPRCGSTHGHGDEQPDDDNNYVMRLLGQCGGLWSQQILYVLADLCVGLRVQVLWVGVVGVGGQAQALGGAEPRLLQPNVLLLLGGALIEHDELVLLPVACLGVLASLWGLGTTPASLGEGQTSVLTAAGLGDPQRVVLLAHVFLCSLRTVLLTQNHHLLLVARRGKRSLPGASHPTSLADPSLVDLLPYLLLPGGDVAGCCLPGGDVAGCMVDAGRAPAQRPAVLNPHGAARVRGGTVLVVDPVFREVRERVFGVCQLAEREREPLDRELAVEVVVAGGVDSVEHAGAVGSPVSEGADPAGQVVDHIVGPVCMDVLR